MYYTNLPTAEGEEKMEEIGKMETQYDHRWQQVK